MYGCARLLFVYVGGGIDYNSGPYNVTFPAGSTIATFSTQIIDDGVLENDETFSFTIHQITEGLLMQITPAEISVIIMDTTGKAIWCILIHKRHAF